PHVVAGRRDPKRGLELGPIDHLARARALDPQIVGGLPLGRLQPPDARREAGEPALALLVGRRGGLRRLVLGGLGHAYTAALTRASRTAWARRRANSRTFGAGGWLPASPAAILSTRAVPTTTASATRATAAARSG